MAQYFARIQGARGPASRLGSKTSGITTVTKSWDGQVWVNMHQRKQPSGDYVDWVIVQLEPHGGDTSRAVTLYRGPASGWQDYHERGRLGRDAWHAANRNTKAAHDDKEIA
jgi:hypothetical protein